MKDQGGLGLVDLAPQSLALLSKFLLQSLQAFYGRCSLEIEPAFGARQMGAPVKKKHGGCSV